ncbi:glycerophosphodiester phosphodiesterase family protein [Paenibacillus thalictri]|uniref:Glycerophosphodiester phosphodiesterase family protein n=1 Tax=Paenibacillus thalictri TaxID=2527873 RepID=A0A4Q9DKG7_9BACL|nr:glycerophosphodiester phosphodiesterase family protein [Paenibacillus thalictri]TBL75281.1 glycerophosphodiester phosphodiesterase family protein [Paenibacillus thalictri]
MRHAIEHFTKLGKGVLIASHRGEWNRFSENSLLAIQAAIDIGAHIVEIDVQKTKDGELILMHDRTVNRTTNGAGKISELILSEIKSLRLKKGEGGDRAELTDEHIPTLREAMLLAKDRILVNIDKVWPFRDEVWDVLIETGTAEQAIFKGTAANSEVEVWLNAKQPRPVYMHIVLDKNIGDLDAVIAGAAPDAYELVFADMEEPCVSEATFAKIKATGRRIWINMMFKQFAGGLTDEPSGWDWCLEHGASVLLTDRSRDLLDYTSGEPGSCKKAEITADNSVNEL